MLFLYQTPTCFSQSEKSFFLFAHIEEVICKELIFFLLTSQYWQDYRKFCTDTNRSVPHIFQAQPDWTLLVLLNLRLYFCYFFLLILDNTCADYSCLRKAFSHIIKIIAKLTMAIDQHRLWQGGPPAQNNNNLYKPISHTFNDIVNYHHYSNSK